MKSNRPIEKGRRCMSSIISLYKIRCQLLAAWRGEVVETLIKTSSISIYEPILFGSDMGHYACGCMTTVEKGHRNCGRDLGKGDVPILGDPCSIPIVIEKTTFSDPASSQKATVLSRKRISTLRMGRVRIELSYLIPQLFRA